MNGYMKRSLTHVLLLILTSLVLTACMINDNRLIESNHHLDPDRAVLIYGMGVNAKDDAYLRYQIQLHELDTLENTISGNCFFHNRTVASISARSEASHISHLM